MDHCVLAFSKLCTSEKTSFPDKCFCSSVNFFFFCFCDLELPASRASRYLLAFAARKEDVIKSHLKQKNQNNNSLQESECATNVKTANAGCWGVSRTIGKSQGLSFRHVSLFAFLGWFFTAGLVPFTWIYYFSHWGSWWSRMSVSEFVRASVHINACAGLYVCEEMRHASLYV